MSWDYVKLKNICQIKSGKRLPKGTGFSDIKTEFPYIRARDIKNGIINENELVYLSEDVQKKIQKYIVNTGDIVITIVGASVGDVGYVKDSCNGFNLTENAVRLTEFDSRVNSKCLLYMLNSKKYWELMQQIAGGSAQPKLGIYKLESIPLDLPPTEIQNRIADILSSYDNLIENNQKQIKLLEEAAQRLYKEWFVDLHFPGYENVKLVDGVPEGWEITPINMVAKIKAGGDKPKNFSEKMTNENKIPVFANGITEKGLMGFTDKAVISNPSVTISARGTVGVVFLRIEPYVPIVRLISVTPIKDKMDVFYLYLYLVNQNFRSTGAAQQQITVPLLKSKNIICPSDNLRESFNGVITPIFNKIEILENHVNKLTEVRDCLLPKLISGEIEV